MAGGKQPSSVVLLRNHGYGGLRSSAATSLMLARKGGKEAVERKLSKKTRRQDLSSDLRDGDFGQSPFRRLLPPPFPIVPFLLAAGAMQYSSEEVLGCALAVGRGIRFTIAAASGCALWTHIVEFLLAILQVPALVILIRCHRGGGSWLLGSICAGKEQRFREAAA